jgi:hypothetical protein
MRDRAWPDCVSLLRSGAKSSKVLSARCELSDPLGCRSRSLFPLEYGDRRPSIGGREQVRPLLVSPHDLPRRSGYAQVCH